MAGFDHLRAARELHIPDGFCVECLIAIGRPGRTEDLPARLQGREAASQRKALHEIAFEGAWNRPLTAAATAGVRVVKGASTS